MLYFQTKIKNTNKMEAPLGVQREPLNLEEEQGLKMHNHEPTCLLFWMPILQPAHNQDVALHVKSVSQLSQEASNR